MARTNIEEKWWTDPRRDTLVSLVGDSYTADGLFLRIIRLAQEYYKNAEPIPNHVFESVRLGSKLVEAGLIRFDENGFYLCGSKQSLEWTQKYQKSQSANGKKSAEARRKKNGTAQPVRTTLEPNLTNPEPTSTKLNRSEPSGSVSDSVSESGSSFPSGAEIQTGPIALYHSLWKQRHGGRAPLLGKDYKLLKGIADQVGEARANALVDAYFKIPDGWFAHKAHDVVSLHQNLAKVAAFLESGKTVTRVQANQAEKTHATLTAGQEAANYFRNKGSKP